MKKGHASSRKLHLEILPQPDDTTCGPTCLHAVYRYYGESLPLPEIIAQSRQLEEGGTLAVLLGCDALRRGYRARLFTFNLKVFDPTWFPTSAKESASQPTEADLVEKLQQQAAPPSSPQPRRPTSIFCNWAG